MRIIPIKAANALTGGLTQTSKMPCKSYSTPTLACKTGFEMSKIAGSICSMCYAQKGFYHMYAATIEPAQHARLDAMLTGGDDWIDGIVSLIGDDRYFRWFDSGDIPSLEALESIAAVCDATPNCKHWLPTREYAMVKEYIAKHGALPSNLAIRMSAMYPDKPVQIPLSLRDIPGVAASNVHTDTPMGERCTAPDRGGKCGECRACWNRETTISYGLH